MPPRLSSRLTTLESSPPLATTYALVSNSLRSGAICIYGALSPLSFDDAGGGVTSFTPSNPTAKNHILGGIISLGGGRTIISTCWIDLNDSTKILVINWCVLRVDKLWSWLGVIFWWHLPLSCPLYCLLLIFWSISHTEITSLSSSTHFTHSSLSSRSAINYPPVTLAPEGSPSVPPCGISSSLHVYVVTDGQHTQHTLVKTINLYESVSVVSGKVVQPPCGVCDGGSGSGGGGGGGDGATYFDIVVGGGTGVTIFTGGVRRGKKNKSKSVEIGNDGNADDEGNVDRKREGDIITKNTYSAGGGNRALSADIPFPGRCIDDPFHWLDVGDEMDEEDVGNGAGNQTVDYPPPPPQSLPPQPHTTGVISPPPGFEIEIDVPSSPSPSPSPSPSTLASPSNAFSRVDQSEIPVPVPHKHHSPPVRPFSGTSAWLSGGCVNLALHALGDDGYILVANMKNGTVVSCKVTVNADERTVHHQCGEVTFYDSSWCKGRVTSLQFLGDEGQEIAFATWSGEVGVYRINGDKVWSTVVGGSGGTKGNYICGGPQGKFLLMGGGTGANLVGFRRDTGEKVQIDGVEFLKSCQGLSGTQHHLLFVDENDVVTAFDWGLFNSMIVDDGANGGDDQEIDWRESWRGTEGFGAAHEINVD